ncbi:cupin domain-containing protein [Leucobacter sp. UT-8R-CII-1-4]|uniref:cupin domain-containing protein n=1 Tax=Leucobacter sp. UT-8R-CII-1-4 TaxID=3040075 RepID=UPI0024A9E11A|nr:cupin domain-containing protein [Leucobacter sp. UT-8R-CII-1-4]MDI6022781.1 cupin domain-containing protein [Leucobacter sp. UT-8R-CII-1-4]
MTSTPALHSANEAEIGEHTAKATALTEGLTEASRTIWTGGKIDTGIWECSPGAFAAERNGYDEVCTILSGRVTLQVEGEPDVSFGPGDIFVTPSGWKGTWVVHEQLRKHYTIISE